jgi:hypothetical protein
MHSRPTSSVKSIPTTDAYRFDGITPGSPLPGDPQRSSSTRSVSEAPEFQEMRKAYIQERYKEVVMTSARVCNPRMPGMVLR